MSKKTDIITTEQPTDITLADGKVYTFPPMNLNTLTTLEGVLGFPLEALSEEMKKGSMKTMRALIYALLVDKYPELTLEGVGELVTMKQIKEISGIIAKIMG